MGQEPNPVEQAVSRALRDSLSTLQRTNEDLNHAIADFVASCSSNRPANSLAHALRAQTAAAALSASLDVLARFIAITGQQAARAAVEEVAAPVVTLPAPAVAPVAPMPTPMAVAPPLAERLPEIPIAAPVAVAPVIEMPPPPPPVEAAEPPPPMSMADTVELSSPPVEIAPPPPPPGPPAAFDVNALPQEQQELHRRANRAAKVSMQDIKLLKPKDVQLGRENKDICTRLREDIEKARKEYDRRFKTILDQPVDYFYQWAVDILADGSVEALGEYPYPSPVLRR